MAVVVPQGGQGSSFNHETPAIGTKLDASRPAPVVGGDSIPLMVGVDPRCDGSWKRLPGFRRISTTVGNSRLKGTEIGGSDADSVTIDFFKPVVIKYSSAPYERRGFVISASNKLVLKYYDTRTSTWAVRTLVSDLDTQFSTRTDFDVSTLGKFLYVSRSGLSSTRLMRTRTPLVIWWEEQEWQHYGSGIPDIYNESGGLTQTQAVHAMVVYRGVLYIGGNFTEINGRTCRRIAQWNGRYWDEVAGGVDDEVHALAVVDEGGTTGQKLWVGGEFKHLDPTGANTAASCIATWNGTSWGVVGNGVETAGSAGSVDCILNTATTNLTAKIYIGGTFTREKVTTTALNGIAYWNGTNWTAMGTTGVAGGDVMCLVAYGGDLYVGGGFTSAGGVANTPKISRWDGSAWNAVGRGVTTGTSVQALVVITVAGGSSLLYVGGRFTVVTQTGATTLTVANIASWSGTTWAVLGSGITISAGSVDVQAIAGVLTSGGVYLVAGGFFDRANGSSTVVANLAVWNGSTWASFVGGVDGRVRVLYREDRAGGIGTVVAGGDFENADAATTNIKVWGIGRAVYGGEFAASVGARHFDEWQIPIISDLDTMTGGATPADLQIDNRYAVMVTMAHKSRGMQSPPSNVLAFDTITDPETDQRVMVLDLPVGVREVTYPDTVRVWRTLGLPDSNGSPTDGPFFLEKEVDYNPSTGEPTTINFGAMSDASLENQPEYTTATDFPGAHSDGSTVAGYKNMLFSLAGSWKPPGSEAGAETYWDLRWSPPWQTTPEFTTLSGFHRVRVSAGESPRFMEVGDFLTFQAKHHIVRIMVQGDYIVPTDGPTGLGVCNREASAAVGGDLYFVTSGGEFVRMNIGTGQWEQIPELSRFLENRWKDHVQNGRMNVAYDALSGLLVIAPRRVTASALVPVEAIVFHPTTRRYTVVGDLFTKFLATGVDPETGRDTAFVVTHTGVILSPDWEERGAWSANGTWGDNHFLTTLGATGTLKGSVTGVSSIVGGYRVTCSAATFDMDSSFELLVGSVVYVSRQDPNDSARRQIVAALTCFNQNSSTSLDLSYGTNTWDRQFGGLLLTNFAGWTNVRVHMAPMLFQIGAEVPRHPDMPSFHDRPSIEMVAPIVGQVGEGSKTTVDSQADFFVAGVVAVDDTGWRFDSAHANKAGSILPFTEVAGQTISSGRTVEDDPDEMWLETNSPPGHHSVAVVSSISTDLMFELIGMSSKAIIDKDVSGVEDAD